MREDGVDAVQIQADMAGAIQNLREQLAVLARFAKAAQEPPNEPAPVPPDGGLRDRRTGEGPLLP